MKQPKRQSRREKVEEAHVAVQRKNNNWNESYGINGFNLTPSQLELSHKLQNNTLTFVDSVAGTGKSMTVLYTFVKEYLRDPSKKLMIIRTPVEAGLDKIGALPNDYNAKVEPHFASTRMLLEQLLSKGKVENDLDHRIFFKIPNFVLGATFDNSLVLIDEVQQLQPNILKLLLERLGTDSKCAVVGDSTQLYTSNDNKRNALKDALPRFFHADGDARYNDVALHKFELRDVMRSDIVKTVITAYTGLE
jgi:phosphate starvation-inducible protein PhoH